ncbi:hypothetical protein [Terracoccus sp. 273MFTsu3.1]|uniref:hypothetical protein n=1 Tax=Terracoccus sp. 273MFTsu3.1 TaxID=1172188 RepID=UPI0012DC7CCD|nr:hypothetical protein [Terracoccus sp. 273MFTsu3.1]
MASNLGADKDTAKMMRAATKTWGKQSVRMTKSNHIQFLPPHSRIIITGSLTGSVTSQRKLRGQLRKAGLAV